VDTLYNEDNFEKKLSSRKNLFVNETQRGAANGTLQNPVL
jgi:hypothetical protein